MTVRGRKDGSEKTPKHFRINVFGRSNLNWTWQNWALSCPISKAHCMFSVVTVLAGLVSVAADSFQEPPFPFVLGFQCDLGKKHTKSDSSSLVRRILRLGHLLHRYFEVSVQSTRTGNLAILPDPEAS